MKRIQHRFTQSYNGRHQVLGPFWQGRYKSKLVQDDTYLRQLVLYIHLNPVVGGLCEDPGDFRWTGHREVVRRSKKEYIVDRDETLFIFGSSRREALRRYRNAINVSRESNWVRGVPGFLPWWRLGRPPRKEGGQDIKLDMSKQRIGMDGLSTGAERRRVPLEVFLGHVAEMTRCSLDELSSRSIEARIVEVRETLALLAVERYGYKVKDVAAALGKHPETASRWIGRALRKKDSDRSYRTLIDKLDKRVAEMIKIM
jgi:hypothetical protein